MCEKNNIEKYFATKSTKITKKGLKTHMIIGFLKYLTGFVKKTIFNGKFLNFKSKRRLTMPTYDFTCEKCNKSFTLTLKLAEYEKKKYQCPKCNSKKVKQNISAFQTITSKKS